MKTTPSLCIAKGFTIVEVLIVAGIVLVLSAILVPNIIRNRMAVNENTALNVLYILRTASVSYYGSQIPHAFAENLEDLSIPHSNPPFLNLMFMESIKEQNVRHGYYFVYTRLPDNQGFTLVARPADYRTNGERSFLMDRYSRIFVTQEDREPNPQTDPAL